MNERILELAEQTSLELFNDTAHHRLLKGFAEKFAELIVRECIEAIQNESMNSYDDWERGLRIAEGAIEKHFGVEE